ncbi:MalY/PatB family protein [Thermohalobacter berrensis]|uniref:cysteine-S-conjugate beta-lyase n=1 Tax=Thermohalobacter berrensis TaxID=99594 RepID=A0A419SV93_9FIRM|nr:PatB family C-S lyase [Thermohalobacter berrensis]RKD29141.1 cystathionine beta-lyase [Thermohalobacter berrensis]
MSYNFDQIIERKNTNSAKWDGLKDVFGKDDVLPMWVADMDFRCPQPIVDAIVKRAEHGIYGYPKRPVSYYESIIYWMKKRHNWDIKEEWISFSPGVVPALNMLIMALTNPGDKVVVQSPVYFPFFSAVKNNNRVLVNNELKLQNGNYVMDFERLEKQIDSKTKMLILCSPHNPVGRVWSREELKRLGEICLKNNIIIVSDEIHSDIVYSGYKHTPIASISEELAKNTITCIAPSKTFNVAGLYTSVVIIPNKKLKDKYKNILERIHIGMGNIFGIEALEAGYRYGEEWLENLLKYLEGNIEYSINFINKRIPKIKAIRPEGTYLLWLDYRELKLSNKELKNLMVDKAKVGLSDGAMFGSGGEGFQRMNIGCPREIIKEGLERIEKAINQL